MTKYYFDLENGDGFLKDENGRELADIAAVHREVATIVLDIASDELNGADPFSAKVIVRDENNQVRFRGALTHQSE